MSSKKLKQMQYFIDACRSHGFCWEDGVVCVWGM